MVYTNRLELMIYTDYAKPTLKMKSTTTWLTPEGIQSVRDDFKRNYKNLKKYPKMTEKDWNN